MGGILQIEQRIDGVIPRLHPQVVQRAKPPIHVHLGAQAQLFVAEPAAVRAPARGEHLAQHQRCVGGHVHHGALEVAGVLVGDELVRQVFEHRAGAQGNEHVLLGRALRGAVDLGGGLGGQQQAAALGHADLDPVFVGAQVAAAGVHDGVADLGGVIEVVRAQHAQRSLVVLPDRDVLPGPRTDLQAQLADQIAIERAGLQPGAQARARGGH